MLDHLEGTHLLGIAGLHTPALTRANSPAGEFPLDGSSQSALEFPSTPEVSSSRLVQDDQAPVHEPIPAMSPGISDDNTEAIMIPRAITFLKPSDTIYDEHKDSANEPFFISRGPLPQPKRKALLIAVGEAQPGWDALPGAVGEAQPRWDALPGAVGEAQPRWDALPGAVQDAEQVKMLLEGTFQWPSDCIKMLKDNHGSPMKPTKENILAEIRNLVEGARSGDQLFLYYAGHGYQTQDIDGDEIDKEDESILTSDGKKILDDVLHEKLAKHVPLGCHLTVVLDSCSSGTGLDLEYNWCENPSQNKPKWIGFIKPCLGDIVLLAACEDGEKSYEWSYQTPIRAMFTRGVVEFLQGNRRGTVGELMRTVRRGLEATGNEECRKQYPHVSSSRPTEEVLRRGLYL